MKGGKTKKPSARRGRKTKAERTIDAALKIAARQGRALHVKHTSANGATLEVELSAAVAVQIREAMAAEDTNAAEIAQSARRALVARPEVRAAIERLRQAGTEDLSATQIETIVEIIVAALKSAGASNALPAIASNLELHGLHDFAWAVRRHIEGPGTITTT